MDLNSSGRSSLGRFFSAQTLSVFLDNWVRFSVILCVTVYGFVQTHWPSVQMVNVLMAAYLVPFFTFSGLAGRLADTQWLSFQMRWVLSLEIPIIALLPLAFVFASFPLFVGLMFLLGCQSAFFGPLKYAYLPAMLPDVEVPRYCARVFSLSAIAMLLGLIGALVFFRFLPGSVALTVLCVGGLGLAILCFYVSFKIACSPKPEEPCRVSLNFAFEAWNGVKASWAHPPVRSGMAGVGWLWFVGAFYFAQFPLLAAELEVTAIGFFIWLAAALLGLLMGSRWAAYKSRGKVEMGLVPLGLLTMAGFGLVLAFALGQLSEVEQVKPIQILMVLPSSWLAALGFAGVGLGAGMSAIPLYTRVLIDSPRSRVGQSVGAVQLSVSVAMAVSAVLGFLMVVLLGFSTIWVFSLVALLNALLAVTYLFRSTYGVLRLVGVLRLKCDEIFLCSNASALRGKKSILLVFPTLLHEQAMQRLMGLSTPFTLVLSGRMAKRRWNNWLRGNGYILDLKGLAEIDGQRALISIIAKIISEGRVIAIDQSMYGLLRQRFNLDALPATLEKKQVYMKVFEYKEESGDFSSSVELSPSQERVWRLICRSGDEI